MWILENWPAVLLFTAGFLGGCASLVIARNQTKHEKSVNTALQDTIGLLQQTKEALAKTEANLGEANAKLDASAVNEKQALELQQKANEGQQTANETLKQALVEQKTAGEMLAKTIDAGKEIIERQQASLDYLTGGNSYLFLHFSSLPNGVPQVRWQAVGDNPVYLVRMSIHNLTIGGARVARGLIVPDPGEVVRIDEERFLRPQASSIFKRFEYPQDGNGDFFVWINQRNGEFCQLVSVRRVDGKNLFAYRVYRVEGRKDGLPILSEKPIRERVDVLFPRDTNGKLPWLDYPSVWKAVVDELTRIPDISSDTVN